MKDEWKIEAERLLFDFGKLILGKNSGGMIKKLVDLRGISGARLVLKMAAEKSDAREYVGAVLREREINQAAGPIKPFVEVGSPQWCAWSKIKKWPETDHRVNGRIRRGWWFETEWPGGERGAATKT